MLFTTAGYQIGRRIHASPLITLSKRVHWKGAPMGAASLCAQTPSLHFVSLAFGLFGDNVPAPFRPPVRDTADMVATDYRAHMEARPDARVVILANTDAEAYALSKLAVPSIVANELALMCDERVFDVARAGLSYAAVYNAVSEPYKRHGLARHVHPLLLIMRHPGGVETVRQKLPRAVIANEREGRWQLDPTEVRKALASASVGLCLSAAEGAMRACMEYLLCGLPVVTTPSLGGRARYLKPEYSITCDATPEAVATAVGELAGRSLDRQSIRSAALNQVRLDRANFIAVANAIAAAELGVSRPFRSIEPFRGLSYKAVGAAIS